MKIWQFFAASCCISLCSVRAASLPVVNPGFEDIASEAPFNEFTFGPLTGWDLYDPGSITDGGDGPNFYLGTLRPFFDASLNAFRNFPAGAAEGIRVGIAFTDSSAGGTGEYGYQQTLVGSKLQANTRYTLKVEVGNIASGSALDGTFFNLNGFPGYRIELRAGGVLLKADNNTLAGEIPEGEFRTSTVTYESGASRPELGNDISIRLVNLNQIDPSSPSADLEVDFDNVRLESVASSSPSLPTVTIKASDPTANERGGTGAFLVRRSGSTGKALVVTYSKAGKARNGVDYQKVAGEVTIPKGKSQVKILLKPIADVRAEGSENVILTLSNSGKYRIGESNSAEVKIND